MADPIQALLAQIHKDHGRGSIMRLAGQIYDDVKTIPSGSLALDRALGVGGYPRGRVVEIYGPEACLDKDTFVQYAVRYPDGHRANSKGGSVERLWERFHGRSPSGDGRGKYMRPKTCEAVFTAPSINEEGRIFHNQIVDVIRVGERECFELTTLCGERIVATGDHRFFDGTRFVPLADLEPGSVVWVHNATPWQNEDEERGLANQRTYLYVHSHPVAGVKIVRDSKTGKAYRYHRLAKSRAVIEAQANGLSLREFVARLDSGDLQGLQFLSRDLHVHHLDEDIGNDDSENLVVLDASEHTRQHAIDRHNNLRFSAVPATVWSVVCVGKRITYDVRMACPFNNYVADRFVVHNSGKTTLALHAIANVQALGETAAYIDAEHAMDLNYARNLGVKVEDLLFSQPDCGEQALNITEALVRSDKIALVVIDSVAALTPKAEIDGEMGDPHMGLQARLMSQALRKLCSVCHKTGCIVLFINQLRQKIGVLFGSPEVTTGGNALKFYASVRIDVRRRSQVKGPDGGIGNQTLAKVVKNKLAPPFQEAEFDILWGRGIDQMGDLIGQAVLAGVIDKSGAWLSYEDKRLGQGFNNAATTLAGNPKLLTEIAAKVKGAKVKGAKG